MTTRAELRTLVRQELGDAGGTPTWSDGLLDQWLVEGIRDYGRHLPKETSATLTSVADQADYSLPADCQRVAGVEHPEGFFRVLNPLSGGDILDPFVLATSESPKAVATQLSYDVWGAYGARTLSLRPAPGESDEEIVVRYLASWGEPAADGSTLATPSVDDELLIWFVCGRALRWLGTEESKRQRWERDRGVSAAGAAGQYEAGLRAEYRRRERRSAPRRLVVR